MDMFVLAALMQAAQGAPIEAFGGVASAGLAGTMLYFWRQDRRDRAEEKRADSERLAKLAENFRTIVQDNTAAMTRLTDRLDVIVGYSAGRAPIARS